MAVRKDDSAVKAVHEALTPHDEAPTVQEDDPDTWSAIMAQEEREAQAEPTAPSSFDVVQAALAHQANNERFAASSVPPGMRRMQITHAFALMRPDGSKISFRPDGTNCDVSGFYDVSNADIDAWPEAFGFTTLKPSDQVDTPDGMIRMHVMSNFLLNRDDHTQVEYKANGTNCGLPGYYDMPPADAEHWFVRHHCENPPDPLPPVPGTQRYIEGAQRREARRRLIEAALDQEEEQAKADVREHRSTRLRKVLGDTVETPAA